MSRLGTAFLDFCSSLPFLAESSGDWRNTGGLELNFYCHLEERMGGGGG